MFTPIKNEVIQNPSDDASWTGSAEDSVARQVEEDCSDVAIVGHAVVVVSTSLSLLPTVLSDTIITLRTNISTTVVIKSKKTPAPTLPS
jgi:hypothetical protein